MTMYLSDDMTEDELYEAACEQRAVTDDEKHSVQALAAMLADALSEARQGQAAHVGCRLPLHAIGCKDWKGSAP